MITSDFSSCTSLQEFYDRIRRLHEKSHGKGYTKVHDAISDAVRGKRYVELGINQGATLAAALLASPSSVVGIDVSLTGFRPHEDLFRSYCDENGIDLEIIEGKSEDRKNATDADVLYVDTIHKWAHVNKELQVWSGRISELIICHDTKSKSEIKRGLVDWTMKNKYWQIRSHNNTSVGFTILERK